MYDWLHRVWYEDGRFGWLLLPFSGIYYLLLALRRFLYDRRVLPSYRPAVPVIVVGNITRNRQPRLWWQPLGIVDACRGRQRCCGRWR